MKPIAKLLIGVALIGALIGLWLVLSPPESGSGSGSSQTEGLKGFRIP